MEIKVIGGGICAAKGFKANGIHCGIRKNKLKKDLSLIYSEAPATTAAVYTTNLVKGAPIAVTKENIKNGISRAAICNSGNANTCNADGVEVARKMCEVTAKALGIDPTDVVVASTGVIGQKLDTTPIENAMDELVSGLGDKSADAADGIMTTDTVRKEIALSFEVGGVTCKIGGIAKGSGMIHPNMATMLVFITSDVKISSDMLSKALKNDIKNTFNMVSVDGDTSTNDMVTVMANGMAGNKEITDEGEDYEVFAKALNTVTVYLCKMIASDGEGASRMLECKVTKAKSDLTAKTVAKSVICSSLVKAAMFGADANWGRILCAAGYSGADIDVNLIDVKFKSIYGEVEVCKNGAGVDFSEEEAKKVLSEKEIEILVCLNDGDQEAVAWGCDLTYDYVKINGDYRT